MLYVLWRRRCSWQNAFGFFQKARAGRATNEVGQPSSEAPPTRAIYTSNQGILLLTTVKFGRLVCKEICQRAFAQQSICSPFLRRGVGDVLHVAILKIECKITTNFRNMQIKSFVLAFRNVPKHGFSRWGIS